MDRTFFSWTVREEKKRHSKEVEYILIAFTILLIFISALNKVITVIPIIIIAIVLFIIVSRRSAQCLDFALKEKGVIICDTTHLWKNIESYNIIDDPSIRGRLILQTKSFSGTITIPIYDEDFEIIRSVFEEKKIKEDDELKPTLVDTLVRFF